MTVLMLTVAGDAAHTHRPHTPRDEREIGGGWLVMKGDGRSENTYTINTMDGAQL